MMIDRISGVNPLNNVQAAKRTSNVSKTQVSPDEISISDEAMELSKLKQIADETPDVREDLVEQIKLKIQDPNYLNEATIASTADEILSAYGL